MPKIAKWNKVTDSYQGSVWRHEINPWLTVGVKKQSGMSALGSWMVYREEYDPSLSIPNKAFVVIAKDIDSRADADKEAVRFMKGYNNRYNRR